MKEIIDVFRMNEISAKTRANIIVRLGQVINNKYGMSLTEPLVFELINYLDSTHEILKDEQFMKTVTRLK